MPAYPPSQIVPKLADQGCYLASESSFYRILRDHEQQQHRGRARRVERPHRPTTYTADSPNQVWSWDITWLPSEVKGRFFYLYMIIDLYSRYGVHWEVHEQESGEQAATLIRPVLHSDNGSPMKSLTFKAKLAELGIIPSYSRPRVSDDNPFVESMFRTLKYGPQWPSKGFKDLAQARQWVQDFMQWYNHQHQHSGIRFVTPAQRHQGLDQQILEQRHQVYQQARLKHPRRWTTNTRNWTPIGSVTLNPDRTSA